MLEHYGHVVAIDPENSESSRVWVNIRKGDTSCASGCSQGAACCQNSYFGKRETEKLLAVDNNQNLTLHIGNRVLIGIPEQGVLYGAIIAYLFPLLSILAALLISNFFFSANDLAQIASAIIGFLISLLIVKHWSNKQANNPRYNAQLIEKVSTSEIDVQNIASEQH